MSIKNIIIENFVQDFTVSTSDKLLYGEIYSPFSLIINMFNLFDPTVFSNMNAKWLDTGAGTGFFSIMLFDRLNKGLKQIIIDDEERKSHIIENMIYLIELKPENIIILKERFGPKSNVIHQDFLSYNTHLNHIKFDYIIGNPPYNSNGIKKVPTNNKTKKTNDGQTIWVDFIKHSLTLLKETTGQLCYIVPSLWMKPDKAGLYNLLTTYKIEKLHCLTNTETNTLFKGEAQTPTCYFLLTNVKGTYEMGAHTNTNTNTNTTRQISLYDKHSQKYIDYIYQIGEPIPLFGQTIIQKMRPFIVKAGGAIKVIKTNMPSKNTICSNVLDETNFPYSNIKTCHLNGLQPELVINYSNIQQSYYNTIKLVLAHKMYGFPYLDADGTYGISNRDNYIIINKSIKELKQLKEFLSTNLVFYIYESTRYRMKYLEKYAFEFLPDISKLPDFPIIINDTSVAIYFGLSDEERKYLKRRKNYGVFL